MYLDLEPLELSGEWQHPSLQRLTGLNGIEFSGVYDGLAFVAARDRAVVFDPLHPSDAAVSHFACTTVARAFRGDGMLVVVCSQPKPMLVALALPATASAQTLATPLPIQPQAHRSFDATIIAHELPTKFVTTRGAAFAADGTLVLRACRLYGRHWAYRFYRPPNTQRHH